MLDKRSRIWKFCDFSALSCPNLSFNLKVWWTLLFLERILKWHFLWWFFGHLIGHLFGHLFGHFLDTFLTLWKLFLKKTSKKGTEVSSKYLLAWIFTLLLSKIIKWFLVPPLELVFSFRSFWPTYIFLAISVPLMNFPSVHELVHM